MKASRMTARRRARSKRVLRLAPFVAFAMVSTACGGGDGGESESTGGEPIKVGVTADISGPSAATYGPVADGFRIYMEALNDRGGIDGSEVELDVLDNTSDPARVTSDVRRFLDEGAVLTLNSAPSSTLGAYTGSMGEMPTIYGNACYPPSTPPEPAPNFFCIGADPFTDVAAHIEAAKIGAEKFGIAEADIKVGLGLEDIPGCRAVIDSNAVPTLEEMGLPVVGVEAVPADVYTMDNMARSLVGAGANVIIHYCLTAQSVALAESLQRLDFDGVYVSAGIVPGVKPAVADMAYPNFYALDWFSLPSDDLQVWADIEAAAEQYDATYEPLDLAWGWAIGIVAEEALRECGNACDHAKLIEVMGSLQVDREDYLELMLSPLEWSAENHISPSKAYQVTAYDEASSGLVQLLDKPLMLDVQDW